MSEKTEAEKQKLEELRQLLNPGKRNKRLEEISESLTETLKDLPEDGDERKGVLSLNIAGRKMLQVINELNQIQQVVLTELQSAAGALQESMQVASEANVRSLTALRVLTGEKGLVSPEEAADILKNEVLPDYYGEEAVAAAQTAGEEKN